MTKTPASLAAALLLLALAAAAPLACESRPAAPPAPPPVGAGKLRVSGHALFRGEARALDTHLGMRSTGAWDLELAPGSGKHRVQYGIEVWEGGKVVKPCGWCGPNGFASGKNELSVSVRDATDGSGGLVVTTVWADRTGTVGIPAVLPAPATLRGGGGATWTDGARDGERPEGDEVVLWAHGNNTDGHYAVSEDLEKSAREAAWAYLLRLRFVD